MYIMHCTPILLGLSFRNNTSSRTIEPFEKGVMLHSLGMDTNKSSTQNTSTIYLYKKGVSAAFLLIDETIIQIGHDEAWLWVAMMERPRRIGIDLCVHNISRQIETC